MSMARSSGPAAPSAGRFAASTRITAKIRATIRCSPTWPRPGTSCRPRTGRALCAFACGRGAQEKTFAELKGEFALDVVPTKHYAANSAWQQLSILAHNLIRDFQLATVATPKVRSRKRTYSYLFRSMRTLRFLLIARAGQLTRIGGRQVLRLTRNPATERLYDHIAHR